MTGRRCGERRHGHIAVIATLVALALVASTCSANPDEVDEGVPARSTSTGTAAEGESAPPAECEAAPSVAERIESSPRRVEVSALTNPDSSVFPAPLVPIDQIRSGGPPPDGIPPIDEPLFVPVCAVDFLSDNEPVATLTIGSETRAYPVQIMTWHEIVNDALNGVPVSVTYCPLCNSMIAFDRRVGDEILDFGTSGALYQSNLVMYDRQTESLWVQFSTQAVVGTLAGTELNTFPLSIISWADFRTAEPDALVLSTQTGFDRDYGRNPYPGYDDVTTNPFLFDDETDDRLAAKTQIVGIRHDGDIVAIVRDELLDAEVMHLEVGGLEIVAFAKAGTTSALDSNRLADGRDIGAVAVYEPVADGQRLTFEATDTGFADLETGSTWNILGRAIAGPLANTELAAVQHDESFWFAWAAFEPETRIVPG